MLLLGFDWPRVYGFDFSGTVVTSGDDRFAEGDEVFGMISGLPQFNKGTCAEYVSVDADVCVLKPNNVSHREAAAVPLVSITAVKMLRACNPAPGARMLVLGGAGGVGSHAIQLAKKMFKAGTVVATASAAKAEAVKSFGADEIVDYRSSKFEEVLEAGSFDVVLDCTGEAWRAVDLLKEGGGMCSIQAGPTVDAVTTWLDESQMDTKRILTGVWTFLHSGVGGGLMNLVTGGRSLTNACEARGATFAHIIGTGNGEIMNEVAKLMEAGALKAVIDSEWELKDTGKAIEKLKGGRALGKIVIIVR